ncbi:Tyrosine-protein kinase transmembrane receptor Ror [Nymphon striatum]|nr:Tyrosine-protein kinase transmembrane receptor Ror [Nymphon striatum]
MLFLYNNCLQYCSGFIHGLLQLISIARFFTIKDEQNYRSLQIVLYCSEWYISARIELNTVLLRGEFLWIYVAIPCVGVVVLIGLLCAICCIRRRSRATSSQTAKMVNDLPSQSYSVGQKYMNHDVEMNSIWQKNIGPIRVREVPPSTVTYLEELGEGTFGNVYRGEVSALNMDQTVTPIVIKTLKTGASTAMFQTFRQEVEVMTDLKHPNIICLLAVCVYDQPFCMLFEFPTGGNLHEHLMKGSRSASAASDKSRSCFGLDVGEFLCISTQVASGMEYLSSQHYVHRDLAARNCLIGDGLNVKISNFGFARETYACDYFHSPTNGLLPIRWMPAEAILYGKFSTESDIWSFGVLLWEILSHGRQPYYGYSNQEVIDMISSHQVLPCPEDSSTQVYGLMLECWSDVAAKRPTFQELHLRLHSWQVLHNMGNLNSSQFFRPHSDSQYSSTGPSNRTGSTHVSSVAAPSSKSLHDSSTHSAISSQPVTVIGLDRSVSVSSRPQQPSSTRSNSPSLSSSTAGLCTTSIQSSGVIEPRVSNI